MVVNERMQIRATAVAGMFYPSDPAELAAEVERYLDNATSFDLSPKAMIVPHAGYIYSGPVAASAYAMLPASKHHIKRVVVIGPDHRIGFRGIAAPSSQAFQTPLGQIPVDREAIEQLSDLVDISDNAHAKEHSIEVQLPFLQAVLGDGFSIVPLVASVVSADRIAEIIRQLWGGDETLFIISSDLSHYHDYHTAKKLDGATSRAIEEMRAEKLTGEDACGYRGIQGFMMVAQEKGLKEVTLDVRNSAETVGSGGPVVGYGAYVFC